MFPTEYVTQGFQNVDYVTPDENDKNAIRTRSALYRENSGFFGYNSDDEQESHDESDNESHEETEEEPGLKNELQNKEKEIKQLKSTINDNLEIYQKKLIETGKNYEKKIKNIRESYDKTAIEDNKKNKELMRGKNNLIRMLEEEIKKLKAAAAAAAAPVTIQGSPKGAAAAAPVTNQASPEAAAAAPEIKTPIKQPSSYAAAATPENDDGAAAAAEIKTPIKQPTLENVTISPQSFDKFKKFEPITDEKRELIGNYEQSKAILERLFNETKKKIENEEVILQNANDLKTYYYIGATPYLKELLEKLGKYNEQPLGFKNLVNKGPGNNGYLKKYFEEANKQRIRYRDDLLNELTRSKLIDRIDEFKKKLKEYYSKYDRGNQQEKSNMTKSFKEKTVNLNDEIAKFDKDIEEKFSIIIIGNKNMNSNAIETNSLRKGGKKKEIDDAMDDLKDFINQKYQNNIPPITETHLTSNSARR